MDPVPDISMGLVRLPHLDGCSLVSIKDRIAGWKEIAVSLYLQSERRQLNSCMACGLGKFAKPNNMLSAIIKTDEINKFIVTRMPVSFL